MTSAEYQAQANSFAQYGGNVMYPYAGLASEAGEVLGKLAKFIRHNDGHDPHDGCPEVTADARDEFREDITKELGDVMWMVAEIATVNKLSLEYIMERNIMKLADRKRRGVIDGSGDNR